MTLWAWNSTKRTPQVCYSRRKPRLVLQIFLTLEKVCFKSISSGIWGQYGKLKSRKKYFCLSFKGREIPFFIRKLLFTYLKLSWKSVFYAFLFNKKASKVREIQIFDKELNMIVSLNQIPAKNLFFKHCKNSREKIDFSVDL